MITLFQKGATYKEIARTLNLDNTTVSKYLKQEGCVSRFSSGSPEIRQDGTITCDRCGETKDKAEFERKDYRHGGRLYISNVCNTCTRGVRKKYLNKDVNTRLRHAYSKKKSRSVAAGIEFSISLEEFIAQFHNQHGLCFYTDVPLTWKVGRGVNTDNQTRLSVDRVIPEKGYVSNNFVFCAKRVNMAKNDFSIEEIKVWMPEWYDRIKNYFEDQTKQAGHLVKLVL